MPLPSPRPNESESNFVSRCDIDPTMQAEFPDDVQRIAVCYSLYEGETQKLNTESTVADMRNKWETQLNKAERENVGNVYALYRNEYRKAIPNASENLPIEEAAIFKGDDLTAMLVKLYRTIGLQFALWYYREFRNFLPKAAPNLDLLSEQWAADFENYGRRYAAQQIVLLRGTALDTLKRVTRQLFLDEAFQTAGQVERARILQSRFDKLSYMQAERIVRTEATTAANYSIQRSALTVYAKEQLKKRWITSMDGRERDWHGAANGQEVNMDATFTVGGESIERAGMGTARNRINCRCVTMPIPQRNPLDL